MGEALQIGKQGAQDLGLNWYEASARAWQTQEVNIHQYRHPESGVEGRELWIVSAGLPAHPWYEMEKDAFGKEFAIDANTGELLGLWLLRAGIIPITDRLRRSLISQGVTALNEVAKHNT